MAEVSTRIAGRYETAAFYGSLARPCHLSRPETLRQLDHRDLFSDASLAASFIPILPQTQPFKSLEPNTERETTQ